MGKDQMVRLLAGLLFQPVRRVLSIIDLANKFCSSEHRMDNFGTFSSQDMLLSIYIINNVIISLILLILFLLDK